MQRGACGQPPCLSATPIVAPIVAPRRRTRRRGLSLVLPRTLRCSMGPVIPRATSRNDRISANRAHVDKSIRALRGSQPHVCAVPMESMHTGQGPHWLTAREGFQTDRTIEIRRGRRIDRRRLKKRHHCVPLHVERGLPGTGRSLGKSRRYPPPLGEDGSNDVSRDRRGWQQRRGWSQAVARVGGRRVHESVAPVPGRR